jgi:hypothetical protein
METGLTGSMSDMAMLRQLRLRTERESKCEKESQVMGKQNEFELLFRDFVSGFGGEVLTETSDGKIADYFFHRHNVVAELKCLMEDQTKAMIRSRRP